MSPTRTRWRLGLTATALLVASTVVSGPAPASAAADVTDYAITVDPKGSGAKIDDRGPQQHHPDASPSPRPAPSRST
ncbi:hypothetical protein [Streptomyces sp. NPDC050564]|uniref:hypothetical protein n=1 Tax=Streptomyces sp. NPDC050564 TaxID=3365631 RepID=UPI0037B026D3